MSAEFPELEWAEEDGHQTRPQMQGRRKGTFPRFEVRPKRNEAKSKEAGRPVYDNVEYIELVTPGDKLNIPHRPVRAHDRRDWPREYAAFKAGIQDVPSGTPLSHWPPISKAEVEELAYFKVRTVEQLAEMTDANAQNLPGNLRRRIKQAQDFLSQAATGARTVELREELEKRDGEIELLKRQMAELLARQQVQAPAPASNDDVVEAVKAAANKQQRR
jgi:hypothetical protein